MSGPREFNQQLAQSMLADLGDSPNLSSSFLEGITPTTELDGTSESKHEVSDDMMDEVKTDTSSIEPRQLTAYSLVYHPSVDAGLLEDANVGIFPPSLVPNQDLANNQPLTFLVLGIEDVKPIYVVGHEFSATGDTCYLPRRLLNDGWIQEGSQVTVSPVELPSVTRMVLQPETDGFAEKTTDPKADLEQVIVSKYQVIQQNDTILVNGERVTVTELEPAEVVSTFNSDPTVEFLPSVTTQQREKQQAMEAARAEALLPQNLGTSTEELGPDDSENSHWTAFSGVGRRLDGSSVATPTTGQPTPPPSDPAITRPKPRVRSRHSSQSTKFKSFAGTGHRLGTE